MVFFKFYILKMFYWMYYMLYYTIMFHKYGIFILLRMSNIVSSFILVYINLFFNLNMYFLGMAYAYIDHLYAAGLLCTYRYCEKLKVH